ncbi:MAG: amylo-alpha-1,6-glucosidase, partial [Actinomycetota bacterium]|nr:amylo-alpha-1,6-glucosidase [Actinomycetota bacterium]
MADLVLLDGSTFFVGEHSGDAEADEAEGLFVADVRHLSLWRLLVDGEPIRPLTSHKTDYYAVSIFGTSGRARVGRNSPISVRRDRTVVDGLHEDVTVENHSQEELRFPVELRFDADFADIFEVKRRRVKRGDVRVEVDRARVDLEYAHDGFRRATVVFADAECEVERGRIRCDVVLGPRESRRLCFDVACLSDGEAAPSRRRCEAGSGIHPDMPHTTAELIEEAPRLETSSDALGQTYRQSLTDLAALRFRPDGLEEAVPAAGVPWFMTLFGRDAAITSYQALPFVPDLARASLRALAATQAHARDDFRDAEPGKILHEFRRGELASLAEVPDLYYGSHDSTPLFLILLDEYERWSGDVGLVRELEPAARAAIEWIERHGDLDGDGYLEYERRSPRGLLNQCWKDSWNSMLFSDGRVAEGPIAACEIQGYAFDARRRAARLARLTWEDPDLADRLDRDAATLRERFNRDFWSERGGHYVLALDGDKGQVDSATSNMGHLLWSGIVDEPRAQRVASRLMAPDLFSGWGIRTMSSEDAGYNPIEYHNGTVWPHDTGLVAEGLRRYGFREEASAVALAVLRAAEAFEHRLPEAFAGFPRAETGTPVEYPSACCPQAWATGATLLALRTLLGLDA